MYSVILPAAGKGTRLGLPYPKEIHRVFPTHSLIDFSLDHIRQNPDFIRRLSIVVTEKKQVVFDYVQSVLPPQVQVDRAYFNDAYTEWPGSVLSAENLFEDHNIVLLPDSLLKVKEGASLLEAYANAFATGADLVFAYCPETDPQRLKSLGALMVQDGLVQNFCDKPDPNDAKNFNGFWASFAFTKSASRDVLEFMMRSVAREKVDIHQLGLKIAAFPIESYLDLGTWPAMSSFLKKSL